MMISSRSDYVHITFEEYRISGIEPDKRRFNLTWVQACGFPCRIGPAHHLAQIALRWSLPHPGFGIGVSSSIGQTVSWLIRS